MTVSFLSRAIHVKGLIASLTILAAGASYAQSAAPPAPLTEFPADALPLSSKEITERLSGQVFVGTSSAGIGYRAEYKSSGYVFVDLSNGARDTGAWRAEEGRVCVEYRRFPSSCFEVRGNKDTLYSRRADSKEVRVMQTK